MVVLVLPLLFLLSGCSSAGYLIENGIGQWKLFNRSRPVSEVSASPHTSESTRRAIDIVARAKQFAVKDLGLKATKNYVSFVQLDSPCVSWAVSAADPIELKEKKWHFPIVGDVPYLGFFKKESAEKEKNRIAKEESPVPDTWMRCVPAFSSLGWFSDPLYSSMLKGNDRDIAETVIHESLHATIWVGNSVDFNEKLANFVGLEGSIRFLEKEFGLEAMRVGKKEVLGEKIFGDFLFESVNSYKADVKNLADKNKYYGELSQKYKIYLEKKVKVGLDFKAVETKFEGWNNAALLAYSNYYSDVSVFEAMLKKCNQDLGRFVRWIVSEREKSTGHLDSAPEEYLESVKDSSCVD